MFTETIVVSSISGSYALDIEDGSKVFDVLSPAFAKGRKVRLDFDGVEVVATNWVAGAFGSLMQEGWEADDIRDRVEVVNDGGWIGGLIDRCLGPHNPKEPWEL